MDGSLRVVPVSCFREFYQTLRLVHDEYCNAGYMEPRPGGLRLFLRDLLAVSTTFSAKWEGAIIGTAAALIDSPAGLPADAIYPAELNRLRGSGRTVIETTKFASSRVTQSFPRRLGRMSVAGAEILKALFQWCCANRVTDWIVVINPKALAFYENDLGFERIGEVKVCAHVEDNPGVMLRLPIGEILEGRQPVAPLVEGYFNPGEQYVERTYTPAADEIAALLLEDRVPLELAGPIEIGALLREHPALRGLIQELMDRDSSAGRRRVSILSAASILFDMDSDQILGHKAYTPTSFALRAVLADLCKVLQLRALLKGQAFICRVNDEVPDSLISDVDLLIKAVAILVDAALSSPVGVSTQIQISEKQRVGGELFLSVIVESALTRVPSEIVKFCNDFSLDVRLVFVEMDRSRSFIEVLCPALVFEQAPHLMQEFSGDDDACGELPERFSLDILLVEDNPVSQIIAKRMLGSFGCRVQAASSGERCLSILKTGSFDLILMDVQLPGLSGFEATRAIREQEYGQLYPTLIYALTAFVMAEDHERCMEAGMDGYLKKPLARSDLQNALAAAQSRTARLASAMENQKSAVGL